MVFQPFCIKPRILTQDHNQGQLLGSSNSKRTRGSLKKHNVAWFILKLLIFMAVFLGVWLLAPREANSQEIEDNAVGPVQEKTEKAGAASNGPMAPQPHGPLGEWACGPKGPWAPWAHGTMGTWAHGRMDLWAHRAITSP